MTLLSLDSTFLVDFLAGLPAAVEKMEQFEREGSAVGVSSVVVYELLVLSAADRRSDKVQKALNTVESLLSRIGIIWPLDLESARLAAEIQRTEMAKGKTLSVRDLLIAATSLANGCHTLVTRNVCDFDSIEGIKTEVY